MKHKEIDPKPQFFDRYINLVDDIDLLDALEAHAPEAVFSNVEMLEALGDQVYAPGKWTINDIVQHCIDTERIMSYRALRFARNDQTALPGFAENSYAQNTLADRRNLEDLLDEYEIVRKATLALFSNFDREMLMRSGIGGHLSKTPISVAALGFMVVGHAIHHQNIISERYLPLL